VADAGADRREGRGRLSTLDQLPDDAETDIVWALEALRARSIPQNLILNQFNARLATRGLGPVSRSAFNRWSVRKSIQFRRLDELRTVTNDLVACLGTGDADDVTVAIAEILKASIYEKVEGGELGSKEILELSRSLNSIVAAQKTSSVHRRELEARVNAQIAKAAETIDNVAPQLREAGMSAERISQMRKEFMGLRV
jgi:Protein of unknown function (DUF3486)